MSIYKPTWLYIKQHNITGLKYFGKTVQNPISYKGSGVYWTRHLAQHGDDVSTVWLQLFEDQEMLVNYAKDFSVTNNIVHSKEWANLKEEDGLMGGSQPLHIRLKMSESHKGKKQSSEQKYKSSIAQIGKARPKASSETKKKMSESMLGILRSEETKKKMSESNLQRPILTCPHCGKSSRVNMQRYHFTNCKKHVN